MINRLGRPQATFARIPYLRPVQMHYALSHRLNRQLIVSVQPYTSMHLSANTDFINIGLPRR